MTPDPIEDFDAGLAGKLEIQEYVARQREPFPVGVVRATLEVFDDLHAVGQNAVRTVESRVSKSLLHEDDVVVVVFDEEQTAAVGARLSSLSRSRQIDPKAAALPRLRLQPDLSAHALDGLAHDREADARAGVLIGFHQALEHLEQLAVKIRGDSNAVVFDP